MSNLVIEWIENLYKVIQNFKNTGQIKDRGNVLSKINSIIYQLKYAYYDKDYLKTLITELKDVCKLLDKIETKNKNVKIFINYFREELEDVERKFAINPKEPYQVFRYRVVKILSVTKHPKYDNLFITKATDGTREYTVVTNIKGVKVGEQRPVVLLPPREFKGIISEAMYVTEYPIQKIDDIKIEDLRKLNQYFYLSAP